MSVSPGTYDVSFDYPGGSTDPAFGICTENVDLTTSVDDTLTVPVTQLTVIAKNSNGDLLQGAKIPANTQELGFLAAFDLFPGQPINNNSYLLPDQAYTTGDAGTATIPLMPMTSPLPLSVDPPAGSDLAPTTISTGLMTTNTTVTATLAPLNAYSISGTVASSISGNLAGQTVTLLAVRGQKNLPAVTRTVTNSAGFYGLTVPAGHYYLQLSGGKANTSGLPKQYRVKTKALALTTGKILNVTLPVIDLTVTVKNQAGKTLQGVKVSVPCTSTVVTLAANLEASGNSCGQGTTNSSGVAKLGLLSTSLIRITASPKRPYHPATETGVAAQNSTSLTIVVRADFRRQNS